MAAIAISAPSAFSSANAETSSEISEEQTTKKANSSGFNRPKSEPGATNSSGYWYGTIAAGALQPQNQSGYVQTHYGYAISGTVQRNAGFSGEVGMGYNFGSVRTELTYRYTSNSLASAQASAMGISEKTKGLTGYTTTNIFIASAYWDIKNSSRFTPYLGGGFGYGLIYQSPAAFQMNYGGSTGSSAYISVPAYQGKVGVSYKASSLVDIFAEGVYHGTTGYDGESGFTPNASQNGPLNYWGGNIGFRFRFGT